MGHIGQRIAMGMVGMAFLGFGTSGAFAQTDPGVRGGPAGGGGPLPGIGANNLRFFNVGKDDFNSPEGIGDGLGPRFNLDSCGGCHAQPGVGGTSPAVNPQVALATALGAKNVVPSFIRANGPIREARFKSDGGVHSLFVISGRKDASGDATGCTITQPDFATQLNNGNVIFRIPTPVFGAGLIEQISETDIINNIAANANAKQALGISGKVNRSGNDGTITRFGWKAQNKSVLVFSGEAYNVEMGITNEMFSNERDGNVNCQFASFPNDVTATDVTVPEEAVSAIEKFSFFMRFSAAPVASTTTPGGSASIGRGSQVFDQVGCALCHVRSFTTRPSPFPELSQKRVDLFSDLACHDIGNGLADGIKQGDCDGGEFRTAPLWGLGQRIFFLHDGRTSNLITAIQAHASAAANGFEASEANAVITNFNNLAAAAKQDLLNFLRSL